MEKKIMKRFTRKISVDYGSWEFSTEIMETVQVNSKEELLQASDNLHKQVYALTMRDIKRHEAEMQPKKVVMEG